MSQLAIIGGACLFPGASSPAEFWRNLEGGVDSRTEGGAAVFGALEPAGDDRHGIYCTRGGFVTGFEFDATGYALAPAYLERLDRVFHWGLHVAREALADGGPGADGRARTGVVVGNYSFPTPRSSALAVPMWNEAVSDGLRRAGLPVAPAATTTPGALPENLWVGGLPARVIGRALGLGGPQLAIDAACSSALYSIKIAADYLATGRADVMLAGGICAPDPTLIHLSFSDLHAYPQDGFSQPFDTRSAGILTGQGAGMFVLKRLADAQRDGDRIHAVIDGVGLSNDGTGRHLLAPNGAGQTAAYEHAYAAAGVRPAEVGYVECHATGTPLGDGTELEALGEFFARHGAAPGIGSVKGNIGHLLTVAGLSSMLKVILALEHERIPPTIGVEQPLRSRNGLAGGDQVVRAARDWPAGEDVRRAGVSAFGFGGTNAHVVMSEPRELPAPEQTPMAAPKLSIVGMGCHFGALDGLDAFERAIYDADDAFRDLPSQRWRGFETTPGGPLERAGLHGDAIPRGAYVDRVPVDPLAQRIPPKELAHFNQQHLLMLKVADEALRDAGFERSATGRRVGVIIAMEMEPSAHGHRARYDLARHVREQCDRSGVVLTEEQLAQLTAIARDSVHDTIEPNEVLSYIGNIMASRISSLWNFTGPCFTVSADSAGGVTALEVASLMLLDESVDAVLVGAVDLAGGPENVAARALIAAPGRAPGGLSFGAGADGWHVGEGAGAVVVTRPERAAEHTRTYASIDAIAVRHSSAGDELLHSADAGTLREAATVALREAGVDAADIEHLEAHAGGIAGEDAAELAALTAVYAGGDGERTCALGSVKALIGDTQNAAALASVIKTALCLHHAYLPAVPDWRGPKDEHRAALEASNLYVPTDSRPWLRARREQSRRAAVSAIGSAGACCHLVLSSDTTAGAHRGAAWSRAGGELLLPVAAPTLDELLDGLAALPVRLAAPDADARAVMREAIEHRGDGPLCAVLVAPDRERALVEADRALRDLRAVHQQGGEWSTPAGSCFASRPLGPDGDVAFVFPGAFNSYPGMLRDLFRAFPGLLGRFEAQTPRPAETFRDRGLYPRTLDPVDRRTLMRHESALLHDVPFMLATGTTASLLYVDLLRDILGVRPGGGFGYSLGESSMMFALNGWDPAARSDGRISRTALFRDRLCGPKQTVRELWGLPAGVADEQVWGSHVLLVEAERARAALAAFPRVFITHVNTPREIVIAGDQQQCRALIAALGCKSARSPVNHVMHCPVVDAELAELADLNRHPALDPGDVELFSAYDYDRVEGFETHAIADRIAHTLRSEIDFPRLVRLAYARGYRYFEVGPASTCSRWVRETLGKQPHAAVSIDRRGAGTTASLSRVLARPVSHGLRVDLTPLADPPRTSGGGRLRIDVPCGGRPVADHIAAAGGELVRALPRPLPIPALPEEPMDPEPTEIPALDAIAFHDEAPALAAWSAPSTVTAPKTERVESALLTPPAPVAAPRAPKPPGVIWDEQDLLEFATGSIAAVFGERFAEIDGYERRVRLPAPPYLFASRVTRLEGETGRFEPTKITTEYDIPRDAWYAVDGQVPPAVTIEAGQCDLLAISYLGIDFENRGERVYRLLDSTLTFHGDLPTEGQTLRYDISLDRFVRAGDTTLFFFSYRCYADGELVLELKSACAGFFDDQQLEHSLGIVESERDRRERAQLQRATFKPLFEVYAERRAPYIPNGDFLFVDRVMALEGARGQAKPGDRMVTEYDSPPDAWYYADNSRPAMPNCIYMESSLQAAILLGYYLGATLDRPGEEYSIRNLDGRATLVKDIDLRGRTIRHHSTLLASYAMPGAILQNYRYELTCDGETFYVGESLFGYFTEQALANQVGLDACRRAATWLEQHAPPPTAVRRLAAPAEAGAGELRLGDGRLQLLDEVEIVRGGGRFEAGYVRGSRRVQPDDWYFSCHFHRDPVMPGSLGVEAVLQALQVYVIDSGLADGLEDPCFALAPGVEMRWKYRGQILQADPELELEVHIKEVRDEQDGLIVIGDASLWKRGGFRIYELQDVSIMARGRTGGDDRCA